MIATITGLELRLRRRAIIGYTLGLAAYVAVVVALYPSFRHETGLNTFTDSRVAALFGASGSLTSPVGWVNANVYGNFVPLIALIMTIGYGASAFAGQDEDGTLSLQATLPVSRRRLAVAKMLTLALQVLPAVALSAGVVLAGPLADLRLGVGPLLATSAALWLAAVDFGLVAVVVGAMTSGRGSALGAASGVAAVSFLISAMAPVTGWVHPLRFVSLFYWSVGDGQLVKGPSVVGFLMLIGVAVLGAAAATRCFERMDVQ